MNHVDECDNDDDSFFQEHCLLFIASPVSRNSRAHLLLLDRLPSSFYMRYYRFGMKVYAQMDDFLAAIEWREEIPRMAIIA